jgi:hypothetical protein
MNKKLILLYLVKAVCRINRWIDETCGAPLMVLGMCALPALLAEGILALENVDNGNGVTLFRFIWIWIWLTIRLGLLFNFMFYLGWEIKNGFEKASRWAGKYEDKNRNE